MCFQYRSTLKTFLNQTFVFTYFALLANHICNICPLNAKFTWSKSILLFNHKFCFLVLTLFLKDRRKKKKLLPFYEKISILHYTWHRQGWQMFKPPIVYSKYLVTYCKVAMVVTLIFTGQIQVKVSFTITQSFYWLNHLLKMNSKLLYFTDLSPLSSIRNDFFKFLKFILPLN